MPAKSAEGGKDGVPSEFLGRLGQNDPDAWLEFFRRVYPLAQTAIEQAFRTPWAAESKEARRLVDEAYEGDRVAALGALEIAWESFQSHFLKRDQSIADIRTDSDFAAWLIRVAYNRWQRENYQDRRVRAQANRGEGGDDKAGALTLYADPAEGPEAAVDLADFQEALRKELQEFTKHLSDVDRQIIRLTFFEGKKPREVKAIVGATTTRCEEVPRLWLLHLAQRFPLTLDFLS